LPHDHRHAPLSPRAAACRRPGADDGGAIRLNKRLAELGLCSRREADDWIERGWVRVNGQLAVMGLKVGPQDQVTVDRRADAAQAQRVTILLHKPVGYVSGQAEDGHQPAVTLIQRAATGPATPAAPASRPRSSRGWRRPGGWTSTPPACWC
jgi:23S rRNA pseudouridine2604 synthase